MDYIDERTGRVYERADLKALDIEGTVRPDGSFIGYSYRTQQWIDTSPSATRDREFLPGMASNPLARIQTRPARSTA